MSTFLYWHCIAAVLSTMEKCIPHMLEWCILYNSERRKDFLQLLSACSCTAAQAFVAGSHQHSATRQSSSFTHLLPKHHVLFGWTSDDFTFGCCVVIFFAQMHYEMKKGKWWAGAKIRRRLFQTGAYCRCASRCLTVSSVVPVPNLWSHYKKLALMKRTVSAFFFSSQSVLFYLSRVLRPRARLPILCSNKGATVVKLLTSSIWILKQYQCSGCFLN